MNFYDRKEKCWLVRSNKRVFGPFAFQEVVDQILSGEVHLMDEVSGSLDRWRHIKDNPEFSAAIEQIKFSAKSIGDNTVTTRMEGTQTITRSMTHSITQNTGAYTDEQTKLALINISKANSNSNTVSSTQNRPVDNKQLLESVIGKKSAKKSSSFGWIYLMIPAFVVFLGYVIFGSKGESQKIKSQNLYQNSLAKAYMMKHLGAYSEALNYFRAAHKERPNDSDVSLELAPLLVQYGNDLRSAKQLADSVLSYRHEDNYISKAYAALGLLNSYENKFNEANAYYKKAQGKATDDYNLKLNMGYNQYLDKNYSMAEVSLNEAIGAEADNSLATIYLAKNYIDWHNSSGNISYLQQAKKLIEKKANAFDGKNEFLLLSAVINKRLAAPKEEFDQLIDQMLESDPLLTLDHYHDPSQDIRGITWNTNSSYCSEIISYLDNPNKAKLFESYCKLLAGQLSTAKANLEFLSKKSEYVVHVSALLAEVYEQMGDSEKSFAAAKYAVDQKSQFNLPAKVLLRYCLKQDKADCLKPIMDGFAKDDLLSYYTAKAYDAKLRGQSSEKEKWMRQGLEISPRYIPLLKLEKNI